MAPEILNQLDMPKDQMTSNYRQQKQLLHPRQRRPSRSPVRRFQSMKELQSLKRNPSPYRMFTKEQKKLDEYITNKIKTQSNFDVVIADPLIEKMLNK